MTSSERIIAGVNLEAGTENVVSYAACFATALGARISLLYVMDYLLTPPTYLASYIEKEKARDESRLREWQSRLEGAGIGADSRVVMGRLHESFMEIVEKTSPELLVIGYRHHALRPSSSERLVKISDVPVLVVRGNNSGNAVLGSVSVRHILCPVDFSKNSERAVSAAINFSRLFQATLYLIHIIPSGSIKGKGGLWRRLGEEERERFDTSMRAEAGSKMASFCKNQETEAEAEIYEGSPAKMISSVAKEKQSDLIVMGARGLSYLESILLGGTTEAVLKSSPCSVLIVH